MSDNLHKTTTTTTRKTMSTGPKVKEMKTKVNFKSLGFFRRAPRRQPIPQAKMAAEGGDGVDTTDREAPGMGVMEGIGSEATLSRGRRERSFSK